jgi:hypothetical protein
MSEWDIGAESASYIDSQEFKKYVAAVTAILEASETPLCTREIHERLDSESRYEWTADALDSIPNLEHVGILPTRYRINSSRRRRRNRGYTGTNHIFPNKDHSLKETA